MAEQRLADTVEVPGVARGRRPKRVRAANEGVFHSALHPRPLALSTVRERKTYVQSFGRGLQLLAGLNLYNGASANELAGLTGINRGVAYRLLETMRMLGYVERDGQTGGYWLQGTVAGLSGGFHCEEWIDADARASIETLGRQLLWPLSLTVPYGASMVLRCCTDQLSPFTFRKMPIGLRMSMAGTASGRIFLAWLPPAQREQLVETIASAPVFDDDAIARDTEVFDDMLEAARKRGYEIQELPGITSIAVPLRRGPEAVGALCLRYYSGALRPTDALKRYLRTLQQTAIEITKAR